MDQVQHSPSPLRHLPLLLCVQQFPSHGILAHASLSPALTHPRPPPEGLSADEEEAAPADAHLVVQGEPMACAGIDCSRRRDRVAQDVEGAEVGLRVFVALGTSVARFGGFRLEQSRRRAVYAANRTCASRSAQRCL
jgi:hypothetical protein